MREIKLTRGKVALVDDGDFEGLSIYRWKFDNRGYASRTEWIGDGKRRNVFMHRKILNLTDPSIPVDHINRDSLDNRRCNLRVCTPSQNSANRGLQKNNTSGFKGVTYHKSAGKWQASIEANGKLHYLGIYPTPEEAYAAYVLAALRLHGEFANVATPPTPIDGCQEREGV